MHAKHEENWCPGRHSHAAEIKYSYRVSIKASVKGVKSLGGHFACLCQGFKFYEVKKNVIIVQKEKGNTFTLLIIFIVKSLQKSKIAQIYYYDPQAAGINVQSPQSESTPTRLTLPGRHTNTL